MEKVLQDPNVLPMVLFIVKLVILDIIPVVVNRLSFVELFRVSLMNAIVLEVLLLLDLPV